MKSINEWNDSLALWPYVKRFMTSNWIFTTWFEKLILWLCVMWSGFSLIKLLF